jgi:aspartate/methionine/tyrosine aminotransferase
MPELNPDVLATPGSGIRDIMNRAFAMPDAIRLEVGEPSFPTPEHIRRAALEAMEAGRTRYTPTAGLMALREAVRDKVRRVNGVERPVEGVMMTPGAGGGLYLALRTLTRPGEGVLLPDPGWANYASAVAALGLRAIPYPLRPPAFVPDPGELARRADAATRVLLVNFPSNPTGAVPDPDWVEAVARLAAERDLWIVSDEVYDQLVFEGAATSPARFAPDRTVAVYSFSKTYAMTGWRLGYVAASAAVTPWLVRLAEQVWQSVAEPTQWAGLAALTGDQAAVDAMRDAYRRRRDLALATAREAGLTTYRPRGAFYLMVDVSASGLDDRAFALDLLENERVAVVPGTAFGAEGRGLVRLSLAASEAEIAEGIRRIARHVRSRAAGARGA